MDKVKKLAADKVAEIRHQLAINVDIAKRDHPEGPVVDGRRIQGVLHSQEILASHITDRLNELEAILSALEPSPSPDIREAVEALTFARDAIWNGCDAIAATAKIGAALRSLTGAKP